MSVTIHCLDCIIDTFSRRSSSLLFSAPSFPISHYRPTHSHLVLTIVTFLPCHLTSHLLFLVTWFRQVACSSLSLIPTSHWSSLSLIPASHWSSLSCHSDWSFSLSCHLTPTSHLLFPVMPPSTSNLIFPVLSLRLVTCSFLSFDSNKLLPVPVSLILLIT